MFFSKIQKDVDNNVLVRIAWSNNIGHIATIMSFIKTPQNHLNCTSDGIGMANS